MFGLGQGGLSWSPCFTRSFNDWEMEEVEGFLQEASVKDVWYRTAGEGVELESLLY